MIWWNFFLIPTASLIHNILSTSQLGHIAHSWPKGPDGTKKNNLKHPPKSCMFLMVVSFPIVRECICLDAPAHPIAGRWRFVGHIWALNRQGKVLRFWPYPNLLTLVTRLSLPLVSRSSSDAPWAVLSIFCKIFPCHPHIYVFLSFPFQYFISFHWRVSNI